MEGLINGGSTVWRDWCLKAGGSSIWKVWCLEGLVCSGNSGRKSPV